MKTTIKAEHKETLEVSHPARDTIMLGIRWNTNQYMAVKVNANELLQTVKAHHALAYKNTNNT